MKSKDFKYDIFVSYASEDKDFVQSLVQNLSELGISVWYDGGELRLGDSIMKSIADGLERSRYFLLILSPSFFKNQWTQFETGVALGRVEVGQKHILPIYYGVDLEQVQKEMPLLADRYALNATQLTPRDIADQIAKVVADNSESNESSLNRFRSDYYNQMGREAIRAWASRMAKDGTWDWNVLDQAIGYFSEAIKQDTEFQHPWINLAYVFHLIGKKNRAIKCLEKAKELAPRGANYPGRHYTQVEAAIRTDSKLTSTSELQRPVIPTWLQNKYEGS